MGSVFFSSCPAVSHRFSLCPGFISRMRRIYPDKRYPCVFQKSGIFEQNPQFHNQESTGKRIRSFEMGFLPIKKKNTTQCLGIDLQISDIILFNNSNINIANNNTVKKYDFDRRQFLSKCWPILSKLPTMWLWMPVCIPLWNTIFETVASFLDIKLPYHKIHPFSVIWWVSVNLYSYRILLPLLRSSLVPIFGQCLHI